MGEKFRERTEKEKRVPAEFGPICGPEKQVKNLIAQLGLPMRSE